MDRHLQQQLLQPCGCILLENIKRCRCDLCWSCCKLRGTLVYHQEEEPNAAGAWSLLKVHLEATDCEMYNHGVTLTRSFFVILSPCWCCRSFHLTRLKAFIFFSQHKHKEIQEALAKDGDSKKVSPCQYL